MYQQRGSGAVWPRLPTALACVAAACCDAMQLAAWASKPLHSSAWPPLVGHSGGGGGGVRVLCGMVNGTLRGTRAALVLIWLQL
jgi:hypothetical protein